MLLGNSLGSGVTGTVADRAGWLLAFGLVAGLMGLLVVLLVTNRA